MSSLFSTFDPQSWWALNLNWSISLPLLLTIYILSPHKTISPSLLFASVSAVKTEFSAAASSTSAKNSVLPALALFVLIIFMNVPGLLPYTFTVSAHMSATVSLALPLWLGHILLGLITTPSTLVSHVVPLGAPTLLIPFMVLIELTSNIIRPLTLSVRLAANMIAGHLLISLLGQTLFPSFSLILGLCLIAMFFLCVLESGVSFIQAYVLTLLSSLYINEMQSTPL